MRSRWTAAVVVLVLIGGCGSGAPVEKDQPAVTPAPAAPAATASPSPSLAAKDEYDTAQRLAGGLNEAGIACVNWERTEDPIGAKERGSCYIGTEEVVASIYANAGEADEHAKGKAETLAGIADVNVVVGGNWTLSCDSQSMCQRIADDFGGRLEHIPA